MSDKYGPWAGSLGRDVVLTPLPPITPIPQAQPQTALQPGVVPQQQALDPEGVDWSAWEAGGVTGVAGEFGGKPAQIIQALPGAVASIGTMPMATAGKLSGIYEAEMQKQRLYAEQAEKLLASGNMDANQRDIILSKSGFGGAVDGYTPTDDEQWQSLKNLAAHKEVAASRESAAKDIRITNEEARKHLVGKIDKAMGVDEHDAFAKVIKWAGDVGTGVAEAAAVGMATGGMGLLPFMMLDTRAQSFRHAVDDLKMSPEAASNMADARGLVTGLVLGAGGKLLNGIKFAGIGKTMSQEVQDSTIKDIAIKMAKGTLLAAEQTGGDLAADMIVTGSNDWTRLQGTTQQKIEAMTKQFLTEAITFGLGYEVGGNALGLARNARVRKMAQNYKDANFGEGPAGLAKMLRDVASTHMAGDAGDTSVFNKNRLLREAHVADELAKIGFKYVDPAAVAAGLKGNDTGGVTVHGDNSKPSEESGSVKFRSGEKLLEALNNTEEEAGKEAALDIPERLTPANLQGEGVKAAKLSKEEREELSLVLQKMNDPRFANSDEGKAAFEAVKPLHDRVLEALGARVDRAKAEAVSWFMDNLHPEEMKNLNDHIDSLKGEVKPVEVAPELVHVLTPEERAALPAAHEESRKRKEAITNEIDISDALKESVQQRLDTEHNERVRVAQEKAVAGIKETDPKKRGNLIRKAKDEAKNSVAKFDEKEFTKLLARVNANPDVISLLSKKQLSLLSLGKRAREVRAEERERLLTSAHSSIEEKVAGGSPALLAELRKTQRGPSDIDLAPGDIRLPVGSERAGVVQSFEASGSPDAGGTIPVRMKTVTPISPFALQAVQRAYRNTLEGKTMSGLSEAAKLAAARHHATSMNMVRALKVMLDAAKDWNGEKGRVAEDMIRAMGLSREERMRVEYAFQDAIFGERTANVPLSDAAHSILQQILFDQMKGTDPKTTEMHARAAALSNPKMSDIVEYARSIGLTAQAALEAIAGASAYGKAEPGTSPKTGNKILDAILEAKHAGDQTFNQRQLSEASVFPTVVKEILRSMAPESEVEASNAPPPRAFDTTTATGRVQALGYVAARAFIREAKTKWMAYIGQKGNDASDVRNEWNRKKALAFINNVIGAEKRGSDAPQNDPGTTKRKSTRSWLLTTTDFAAVTKTLLEEGFLRDNGKGGYEITGMSNAASTILGLKPEMIAGAWEKSAGKRPDKVEIPTLESLLDGLTGEQNEVLNMYHGLGAYDGITLGVHKIAQIMGKSDGWVKAQLDHSTQVIASRFPNFALLADDMARDIFRLKKPADMYEDAATTRDREVRLQKIEDTLVALAQMPGFMNAYSNETGVFAIRDGKGMMIHKGLFHTLRERIIDEGAPVELIKEREDARADYEKEEEHYRILSAKNERFRTAQDNREIAEYQPIFDAAKDRYLDGMRKVFESISPETRAMLDFVHGAVARSRNGVGKPSAINRGEDTAILRYDKKRRQEVDNARLVSIALGEDLAIVLRDKFGISRDQSIDEIRETVIASAQRAFLDAGSDPTKAAFRAAMSAAVNELSFSRILGKDEYGINRVGRMFLASIRDSTGHGDRTKEIRDLLTKRNDDLRRSDYALTKALEEHAVKMAALDKANARADFSKAAIALHSADLLAVTSSIATNLFAMRLADPANAGIVPSVRFVKQSINMIEKLPVSIGYNIDGMTELVANMRSLVDGNSETRLDSARAVSKSSEVVVKELRKIQGVLRDVANGSTKLGRKPEQYDNFDIDKHEKVSDAPMPVDNRSTIRFSKEEGALAESLINQIEATKTFINAIGRDVTTTLERIDIDSKRLAAGEKLNLPNFKTPKALSEDIRSANETRGLLDRESVRLESQRADLLAAQKEQDVLARKINRLKFDRNEAEKVADRGARSVLPASEEELSAMFGIDKKTEYRDDTGQELNPEELRSLSLDEGNVPDEARAFAEEAGKGSTLAQQMKATGSRLSRDTLNRIADNIVSVMSGIRSRGEDPDSTTSKQLIDKHILELGDKLDKAGISLDDSVKMQLGMAGIAEIAGSKFADLINDRSKSPQDMVKAIHEALGELDPKRSGEMSLMLATHAVENLMGKRIESSSIDHDAIKAMAEDRESNLAKELAAQQEKAEKARLVAGQLEAGIANQDTVGAAIQKAQETKNNIDIRRAMNLASKLWKEQPGTPENYELKQQADALAPKGSHLLSGMALDLGAALMMTSASPEGAALMLGAGVAYVSYKLGMERNARFADVMNRVKAKASNTVSEIAAKIKGVAKGISDFTARIMAAVFKDGGLPGGGNKSSVTEERIQSQEVVDKGAFGVISTEPITKEEIARPYDNDYAAVVESGISDANAVRFLNGGGLNLDMVTGFAGSMLDKSTTAAGRRLARERRQEEVGKTPRQLFRASRELGDTRKKVTQWVHRMATDEQSRFQELMLLKLNDKDRITGAFQPMLVKYAKLKEDNQNEFRALGTAITDSSVQERIISNKELTSRYNLSPHGLELYRDTVGMLKGAQRLTLKAYDRKVADDVSDMRNEQNALTHDENYDRNYKNIESRIDSMEKEADKIRSIIQKNPVFISLLRSADATRRIDLVDRDGNHIGMDHIKTDSPTADISEEQRNASIEKMLQQHARKTWYEDGMLGDPNRIYLRLRAEYERGSIKDGYFNHEQRFVPGETKSLDTDDHMNFLKQSGGMMSQDTLEKLVEARGETLSAEAARLMFRDLAYFAGAREVTKRLTYERSGTAGYSEDIIGALSMHAHSTGYMISNLKYANQIRSELSAFRTNRVNEFGDGEGHKKYKEMLHYVVSMNAPTGKATPFMQGMDYLRAYSAWRALAGKVTFGATQFFQGCTTTQLHMMSHYDHGYMDKLYRSSWAATKGFMEEMMKGVRTDLSMLEPEHLDKIMDNAFTYERFQGVWKSREEAARMIPIVKEVMKRVVESSTFKDVNVGMQFGVDDALEHSMDNASGNATKWEKGKDAVKGGVGYIARNTENMNRLRDIISYTVACATESRATDAGKMTGKWAEYGFVNIKEDGYSRLTFDDLKSEVAGAMKARFKNQDIGKKELEGMIHEEVINKIMTFAERNSAHSNFNTGRGYGSELIWSKDGGGNGASFLKTAAMFRLFPVNVLNAWRIDRGIIERRAEAEGRPPTAVSLEKMRHVGYAAVASMLLGGAFAVPMAGMLTDLLSFIWNQTVNRALGKPRVTDVKRDFIQWTYKNMGEYPSRFVAAGVFGLTPFYGLGAQLSAGEGPLTWDAKSSFVENVGEQILGANVGAVKSVQRGYRRIAQGDVVGGVSNIVAPVGVSNVVDAYWNGDYAPGRKKVQGTEDFYKYSSDGMSGRAAQFAKALGATPYKSSVLYDEDSQNYKLRDARKDIISNIQDAYEHGNITEKNFKEVMEWNQLMLEQERPEMIVNPRPGSMKGRIKRELTLQGRVNNRLSDDEEED